MGMKIVARFATKVIEILAHHQRKEAIRGEFRERSILDDAANCCGALSRRRSCAGAADGCGALSGGGWYL
jgi:hypothetical protein